MRSAKITVVLALGLLGAGASVVAAAVPRMDSIDFAAAQVDSMGAHADSTAAMPVAPAPAAQTPAPAPAPAAAAPAAAAPPAAAKAPNDRIYYGGTVTVAFGSTTSIGFWPMFAYKLTPKISAGAEAGYEYVSYNGGQSTHNYGGSLFGRYRVGRNLYAHAEYQQINYEIFTTKNSSSREWVPALLLGGGYVKSISPRTSVYGEVLFDVLQADNTPYKDWDPIVRFGVAVGF